MFGYLDLLVVLLAGMLVAAVCAWGTREHPVIVQTAVATPAMHPRLLAQKDAMVHDES